MQIKPFIIAKTDCDWPNLYNVASQSLGYKINRAVDSKNIVKQGPKFIISLNELLDEDYQYSPEFDGLPLDHFSYTLGLFVEDYIFNELLHYRMLKIIGQQTLKRGIVLCVLSGTLRNFRDFVIDSCSKSATVEIRDIGNEVYNLLCGEGLSPLWSGYTKLTFKDSMVLVPQK